LAISHASYAAFKNIGIIVPLEHESMNQIVSGIKESFANMDVEIKVKYAHSDPNIMLALIKQMKTQNIDLIMPIGTSTCHMTISHIKNKPIVCVAAQAVDQAMHPLATSINDEIPTASSLAKLPKLRHIAVIYSASEKVAPEIEELKKYATQNGISLHLAMIHQLVDMPLAVQTAPHKIEAFLILKDHLICSGVNILTQEAIKRSIPIIASDEGSVIQGATIAIGVREKSIGTDAALITKHILQGAHPSSIAPKTMDSLVVFVNEKSILKQRIFKPNDILKLTMPIIAFKDPEESN
jgi:putative ABC transport system substrate-binding protein